MKSRMNPFSDVVARATADCVQLNSNLEQRTLERIGSRVAPHSTWILKESAGLVFGSSKQAKMEKERKKLQPRINLLAYRSDSSWLEDR